MKKFSLIRRITSLRRFFPIRGSSVIRESSSHRGNSSTTSRFAYGPMLLGLVLVPWMLVHAEGIPDWKIIKITPEELPAILKQSGPFEKLSAKEYAELVTLSQSPKNHEQPRLIRTKYRARLQTLTIESKGQASTALIGSAEWSVSQKSTSLQRLTLGEISVGLGVPRWQDGSLAWLTGGENSALVLDSAGEKTLNVDWSARGVSEAGELRWELRLPKAPIAELELELPNGWIPYTSQNDLVFTGPFFHNENLKTWRIHFGGESRLELVVRPPNQDKAHLFHKAQLAHEVFADKLVSNITYQIESQPSPVDEFVFVIEPITEVSGVRTNNLSQWAVSTREANKKLLKVKLTEPTHSAVLTLSLLQRGHLGEEWKLPQPDLQNSTPIGLEVRTIFPEEVVGQDWKLGSYRLVQAAVNSANLWLADFLPVGSQGEGPLNPISFRPKSSACLWSCKQETVWLPDDAGRIESTLYLDIQRGSLNKLILKVPAGTEVEQVETAATPVSVSLGESATRLELHFARPLSKADKDPLKVRCRLPVSNLLEGRPFPDLEPVGMRERSGSYRIQPPAGMILETRTFLPEIPDTQTKSFSFGLTGVSGLLDLRPAVGNVRTHLIAQISPERISTRLTVTPQSGKLSDVIIVAPRELQNWSPLGEQTTLSAEVLDFFRLMAPKPDLLGWGLPSRSVHKFHFSKPMEQPLTFVAQGSGPADRWTTLPIVLGSQMTSEISCPARYQLDCADSSPNSERSARYESRIGVPNLLRVRLSESQDRIEVSGAQLQNVWSATDRLRSTLRFRVRAISGGELPISWPENARILSIKIGEKLAPPSKEPLAIPQTPEPLPIEIEYEQPFRRGVALQHLQPPLPQLQNNTTGIEQTWVLPPSWTVLNSRYWYQPQPSARSSRWQTLIQPFVDADFSETWRSIPHRHSGLWLVHVPQCLALCVCLSLLLSLGCFVFRKGKVTLFILSVVFLLSSFTLPDVLRPLVLLSAGILLVTCWRMGTPSFVKGLTQSAGVRVSIFLLLASGIFPSPPPAVFAETITIYEVISPDDAGESTWYLPVGLADRIRGQRTTPQIIGATYNMKIEANLFRAEARYLVRSFDRVSRSLKIPLSGVRLRSALLNGTETFPSASTEEGYEFDLKGIGEHILILQFEVLSKPIGTEREIRFAIPEHPVSQLTLESDLSLRDLRLMAWRGVNRLSKSENSEKITADLGRVKFINLRGRIPTKGIDLPLRSRSCHIWNIEGSFAKVSSVFDFDRIPSGGISQLRLAVPEGLLTQDIQVRLLDPTALPVGVKSWRILSERTKDDWPILLVDFSEPISTRFRLVVQLVPPNLLPPQAKAKMLRCLNSQDADSYLALRFLKSEDHHDLESNQASEISAEAFQKKIAPAITGDLSFAPVRSAYRRGQTGEPSVTFKTWPEKSSCSVEGNMSVKHSPVGLNLQGTLNLSGLAGVSYLELEGLGSLQSLALWNDEIQFWNRVGGKAQVFLKKGVSQLTINLVANIPFGTKSEFLELPSLRVKGSKSLSLKWKLTPAEGYILIPERKEGTTFSEENRTWNWVQNQGETGGVRFRWLPPVAPPPLQLTLRLQGEQIHIDAQLVTDEFDSTRPHVFSIHWPDFGSTVVKGNWPTEVRVRESIDKTSRHWTIEVPAGRSGRKLGFSFLRPFTEQLTLPRVISAPSFDNQTIVIPQEGLRVNDSAEPTSWRFGDPPTLKLSQENLSVTRITDFDLISVPVQKGWLHTAKLKGVSLKGLSAVWGANVQFLRQVERSDEYQWVWHTETLAQILPTIQSSKGETLNFSVHWFVSMPSGLALRRPHTPVEASRFAGWTGVDATFEKGSSIYRLELGETPEIIATHLANTADNRVRWAIVLLVLGSIALGLRAKQLNQVSYFPMLLALLMALVA